MYLQRLYRNTICLMNGRWITLLVVVIAGCGAAIGHDPAPDNAPGPAVPVSATDSLAAAFAMHSDYYSDGFDFPVGAPDGRGYYNAQPFRKNNHLGDDWNGNGGGNSDYGDPVSAVSNGYVTQSINFFGGWGKVVRMVHAVHGPWKMKNGQLVRDTMVAPQTLLVESLYAHMDTMMVKKGQWVTRGQQIGRIGDAEGQYYAHLHLEIREQAGMALGGGYSPVSVGYLDPTRFIRDHRRILK